MVDVRFAIESCGGVASYRALDAFGVDRREVRAAVRSGAITSVRTRWFAVPHAAPDVVRAVRVGGTLTGNSVATLRGLWTADDRLLHVRVPATASRLGSPGDRRAVLDPVEHRVCVHYGRAAGTDRGCDPLLTALAEMFHCGDPRMAVVAIDSALERMLLHPLEVKELRALVAVEHRRWLDRVDGRSQSGLESLLRLLFSSHRIPFVPQARIAGVGHVDILVGDRLVIEVDGKAWHQGENFEEDRRRDLLLIRRGYLVVRLSYRQVMDGWDATSTAILELVRRGDHRWGARALLRG